MNTSYWPNQINLYKSRCFTFPFEPPGRSSGDAGLLEPPPPSSPPKEPEGSNSNK